MSDDTSMLRKIAIVNAETAHLLCRIAGMQAENQIRIQRGESLAYDQKAFEAEQKLIYTLTLLQ
jgi:hypothetical protein